MGMFGDFVKMELGQRTGKWAGDKVFGKNGESVKKYESDENKNESEVDDVVDIERKKLELEEERLENEKERLEEAERKQLNEKIKTFSFSSDKDDISEKLNYLFSLLVSEKDKNLKNVCMEKVEFGLMKLNSAGGQVESEFFSKKLQEYRNKKKGLFGMFK